MLATPERVRFDRMTPIFKEPFEPDDDATIATNGLEIAFFLERNGCEIVHVAALTVTFSSLSIFCSTPHRCAT